MDSYRWNLFSWCFLWIVTIFSMALRLTRRLLVNPYLVCSRSLHFLVGLSLDQERRTFLRKPFGRFQESDVFCKSQCFSSRKYHESLCWGGSSHEILLRKLENALKEQKLEEAWETFHDFKRLYGFPNLSVVGRLVTEMCYSSRPHWLQKACDLVLLILKEKSGLIPSAILTRLVLSLARAEMPLPTSMILRLMLEKMILPPLNVLCLVVLHMVKTEVGTCIASNFLVQICDCFLRLSSENSKLANLMKPDTLMFNLVLDACVRFASSLKGQQIIELMSQTGVVADAHTIIIIAQIHEMNGQRDEIKKFKEHIDSISAPFITHYRQFYDSLLSLHFKFDDIDAAAELVLNMNRHLQSHRIEKLGKDFQKPCFVPIGSQNIRNGLKIQIAPDVLRKDFVLKVKDKSNFVILRDGKLLPSNRSLAKIINGCKRDGKISELSNILYSIEREFHSFGLSSLCSDVIDACIDLGWVETAHDILDDMESAGHPMSYSTYLALLMAYHKQKMFGEGNALLKQIQKAGFIRDLSEKNVMSVLLSDIAAKGSQCKNELSYINHSALHEFLVQEIQESEKAIPPILYELNSSIYFFCKAKMIGDALKIYRRMQEHNIQPTLHTFAYLVDGYSSLEMYRNITILWGDIKRNMERGNLLASRDLYEFLLLNFLQGGYFERVMEIIGYMEEHNMYADKWMYRSEFLKLHKNLYRGLKATESRTEAQGKRLEHVKAFKKWTGID